MDKKELKGETRAARDRDDKTSGRENQTVTGAWEKVKLARHEQRPYTLDYVERLFENFVELHGDRKFADDPAIVAGIAFYHGRSVVIIGQQKGRDLKQRLYRNFGQANPEGYRKALRMVNFAEKFDRPIITLIDTPGAYPGLGAEERGIAEAIAYNLREMSKVRVPILVVVIGEGGSGGALGISVGDYILMLENAIYSVISPESCSAILWRDQQHAETAAENLKLTAKDLHKLGIIDEIVPEPAGGAHTDADAMARILDERLMACLTRLSALPAEERLQKRYEKFRKMGYFEELLQAQR